LDRRGPDGRPVDTVLVYLHNARVGPFLDALEPGPEIRVSRAPIGFLPLQPPEFEAARQATDVAPRSPVESFLNGLQSIGSKEFLGYALTGGMVSWLGLYTKAIVVLVGAILVAPFGDPAMNTAITSARGDLSSLLR
jgi:hypothetical protein